MPAKLPKGRCSHQGHCELEFRAEQSETMGDSFSSSYAKSIGIGAPDQYGRRSAGNALQDVGASTNAAVDKDRNSPTRSTILGRASIVGTTVSRFLAP